MPKLLSNEEINTLLKEVLADRTDVKLKASPKNVKLLKDNPWMSIPIVHSTGQFRINDGHPIIGTAMMLVADMASKYLQNTNKWVTITDHKQDIPSRYYWVVYNIDGREQIDLKKKDSSSFGFPKNALAYIPVKEPSTYECEHGCHFQEPYGFVPMADCPIHDK